VIFDSLAMGIEWLTVQEFYQMLGRAGRPDYHDKGTVWLLVEPDGVYHHGMDRTEDEVAFTLLKGEMEPVVTRYDGAGAVAETLANVAVAGAGAKRLNDRMVGDVPTKHAVGKLLEYDFIEDLSPTPLGRAVTEHFLSPEEAHAILELVREEAQPHEVVARMALRDEER
jgi:helicase